jgi:elongation factor P
MKVDANGLRNGHVIVFQDKLWVVTNTQHTQPGKGGAYIQAEMKCMADGTKRSERFRSNEEIERAWLEEKPVQFLYNQGTRFVCMDPESYEQLDIAHSHLNGDSAFLEDGMMLTVVLYEGIPIAAKLPSQVTLELSECDLSLRGQTATSSYKPAKLVNGLKVMVPQHLEVGMKIVVNTEDCTYAEKAKN